MDITLAKEYILIPLLDEDKIFISKDLDKILAKNGDNGLIGVYGVSDCADGEVLMTTDYDYCGEPIIMRRFLHKKFFVNEYTTKEVIYL